MRSSLAHHLVCLGGVSAVLGASLPGHVLQHRGKAPSPSTPTVTVKNGSYSGSYLPTYRQDVFLGMPFAQPPLGDLRFRVPQSLNTSWTGTRNATAYSPECIGYGSDDWLLGNYLSEDCLTLNVVRPAGVQAGDSLPVAVWIHGGGYFMGGGMDPRYNLSFIVQQAQEVQQPFVAVSINYRLAEWGFLYGSELAAEGSSNLGLRDQRLALHWVQENIAAFGGDAAKVTIWGESAGANSVGTQLVAYSGRDDGLFRAAVSQSGAPSLYKRYVTAETWQPYYDSIVNETGCAGASGGSLACLRQVPTDVLSAVFNGSVVSAAMRLSSPVIDDDFLTQSGTTALRNGEFVRVPYLLGATDGEGGSFGTRGINTDLEFLDLVRADGVDDATALTVAALYPDIPAIGVPSTLHGRPPADQLDAYGYQWKRSAAYNGDRMMHAGRRLANEMWAKYGVDSWSYRFNVLVNGRSYLDGSGHFSEVAFVFHTVNGLGYETAITVNPFANMPASYPALAKTMSRMWVGFITQMDPNAVSGSQLQWPKYSVDDPHNIVFDTNVTGQTYLEQDIYRAEGIAYLGSVFDSVYGS